MSSIQGMTDLDRIRALAQGLIEERDRMIDQVGLAGATVEVVRAGTAERVIALLDAPAPTSPDRIPPAIRVSIDQYAAQGLRPGGCVYAILANQLSEAFGFADLETRDAMPAILAYVASALPARCHGSQDLVERWIRRPRS